MTAPGDPTFEEARAAPRTPRDRLALTLAVAVGLFTFYTVATGAFGSLTQRGVFVGLISALAVCMYPLGAGTRWRPFGIAIDLALVAAIWVAAGYAIVNFERIMVERPFAEMHDVWLAGLATLAILELARRAVSAIFPVLVLLMLAYALFGDRIPGQFGHRGFDVYFVSETVFLSDLGLWGMLVGVAATTLAAFILFGAFLLHTGAGTTFFKVSARAAGASVGGAAKIATVASGFFGTISGSTVANVATTGNFTIPLMKRLRYPPALAGGVEAIASTGGQLAPPIMGTAAFVMAELVGENYWRIAAAAILPAIFFYLGIFTTIDTVARRRGLFGMAGADLPSWADALDLRALAPIVAALGGILFGVWNGNSIGTTAFYGIIAMIAAFVAARISAGAGPVSAIRQLAPALETGGKGVVIVGIMLTAAQIFVALLNLTGVGVTLTGAILSGAGQQLWAIALVMAIVCLIAGMGLPTSAAYVLVAAVFAPALIQIGIDALKVHFFVLYYATLSVITPPVCVGVFVAASISGERWFKVAKEAMRLGAVAYALPMLFLLHDGFLLGGDGADIGLAAASGAAFTLSLAYLLGGRDLWGTAGTRVLWAVPLVLAAWPTTLTTLAAFVIGAGMIVASRLPHVSAPAAE